MRYKKSFYVDDIMQGIEQLEKRRQYNLERIKYYEQILIEKKDRVNFFDKGSLVAVKDVKKSLEYLEKEREEDLKEITRLKNIADGFRKRC